MTYETSTSLLMEYHTPLQKLAFYHAIQLAVAQGHSAAEILEILRPPRHPAPEPSVWPHLLTDISIVDKTAVRITTNSSVFLLTAKGCHPDTTSGFFVCREGTSNSLFLSSPVRLKLSDALTVTLTPGLLTPTLIEILPDQFAPLTAHLQIPTNLWDTLRGRLFVGLTLSPPGIDEPSHLGTLTFTALLTALDAKPVPRDSPDALSFHEKWSLSQSHSSLELNVSEAITRYFCHPLMGIHLCQQFFACNPAWRLRQLDLSDQKALFLNTFPAFDFSDFPKNWYDLLFSPQMENYEGAPMAYTVGLPGDPPPLFLCLINEGLPVHTPYAQRATYLHNVLQATWQDYAAYSLLC